MIDSCAVTPRKSGSLAMSVCGPKRSPDHERQETHDGTEDPHFAGSRWRQNHHINPSQRLTLHLAQISGPAQVLLATLGYPLFESVARLSGSAKIDEIFYCTASDAKGRGLYTPEGFVVLKGSTGRKECVPSFVGTSWHRLRLQLVKDGVIRENGDQIFFERDYLFKTPSMAAAFVMARSANGWTSWKNEAGKTLDSVYR